MDDQCAQGPYHSCTDHSTWICQRGGPWWESAPINGDYVHWNVCVVEPMHLFHVGWEVFDSSLLLAHHCKWGTRKGRDVPYGCEGRDPGTFSAEAGKSTRAETPVVCSSSFWFLLYFFFSFSLLAEAHQLWNNLPLYHGGLNDFGATDRQSQPRWHQSFLHMAVWWHSCWEGKKITNHSVISANALSDIWGMLIKPFSTSQWVKIAGVHDRMVLICWFMSALLFNQS